MLLKLNMISVTFTPSSNVCFALLFFCKLCNYNSRKMFPI